MRRWTLPFEVHSERSAVYRVGAASFRRREPGMDGLAKCELLLGPVADRRGNAPGGSVVEPMRRVQRVTASGVRRPQSQRLRRRQRCYFAIMGLCLLLIVLAWNLARLWSTTAAVAISVVAAVLPPIAVIIANWGEDR